jgi:hypothetical protein
MITTTDKSALLTFVNSNRQGHFLLVAAIAANLTRVSWVHSFKRPASVFSFAFRYLEKPSPGHVADCLREARVFHHPSNVQIFNCDHVKSSYKIGRYLVLKIIATARYFQVRLGDYDSLFGAPLRSHFLARKPPLLSLQLLQRVLEMARILDALESGEAWPLPILDTSKEAFKSFVKAFERILLDCPQMAFHFRQRASFSQMTRLFDIAKRRAGDLITGDSLSESGVVDLARVFEFTIARFYKAFVGAKLELESLDSGIFRISHCVSRLARDAHWRDLAPGCSPISGRCAYTTTGPSIKQQNSEWKALRTREIVRRWPLSIPLRFTAEGGGSFTATLRHAHSKERLRAFLTEWQCSPSLHARPS